MSNITKYTGREFRPFDWYGWIMSISGMILIAIWANDNTITWFEKIVTISTITFVTIKYMWRVIHGRVYKRIYYDTVIHIMYELDINGETYYVCSENEEELRLYLDVHYPNVGQNYKIISSSEIESYIKREHYE